MKKRFLVLTMLLIFSVLSSLLSQNLMPNPDRINTEDWREVNTGITENLNQLSWISETHGWAVGNNGTIVRTTDGGNTWTPVQSNITRNLRGISWVRNLDGTYTKGSIVGEYGTILTTSDAGTNWTQIEGVTGMSFYSIATAQSNGKSENPMVAVGEAGLLYRSTDNGQTWFQLQSSYPYDNFNRVYFIGEDIGFIVGTHGIILKTTNGGETWEYAHNVPTLEHFRGIHFFNNDLGTVVGENGTILSTKTGGDTWQQESSGTQNDLSDVFGVNNFTYVCGNGGTLLQSNSGMDYQPVSTGFNYNLNDITKDQNSKVWIAGNNGKIITNAPQPPQDFAVSLTECLLADFLGTKIIPRRRVHVNSTNPGNLDWKTASDRAWLYTIAVRGTGTGYFDIYADGSDLPEGTYQGSVTVSSPGSTPEFLSIDVSFNHLAPENDNPPFGGFDFPENGATVHSSIPVTGWALDDVGLQNVRIYRKEGSDLIYLGDASFIEGARPDIAQSYPGYPNNHIAGWGYMLLTNFLPNGGNGQYTITAIATDINGRSTSLGQKIIICNNAQAIKPFGAIDTPSQGGTAFGTSYDNCGWVLAYPPNYIPTDGTSILVYIDGVNVGHPSYNQYRSDIAALFPGFVNNKGAGANFKINTTNYTNGLHSIQWTATDNAGNTDGIGSRFFSIENTSDSAPISNTKKINYGSRTGGLLMSAYTNSIENSICSSFGINPFTQGFKVANAGGSPLNWQASADADWITLNPQSGSETGWIYATIDPSGLTAGNYSATVTLSVENDEGPRDYVEVNLNIMEQTAPPIGNFDYPDEGRTVSGTINLSGWALDDIAVQSVKINRKISDGVYEFIGNAALIEGARPDIETFYSYYPASSRGGWIYPLTSNTLADGEYEFQAEVSDYEGNIIYLEGNKFNILNTGSTLPFGSIDKPEHGAEISGSSYEVTGWALTPQPNQIPTDGSTIAVIIDGVNEGTAVYNLLRNDIAAQFPGLANSEAAGISFDLNTTNYIDGTHSICFSVTDNGGNSDNFIGARYFTIKNNSIVGVKEEVLIPDETKLLPVYPNPFNPSTTINYELSEEARTTVIVYDILGRKIRTLLDDEYKSAGRYKVNWNGRNDYGSQLASGIYFIVMKTDRHIKTQKCILIK